MLASIRFVHKIAQCPAFFQVPRDISNHNQPHAIRHKFLNKIARDAGLEPKEIVRKPLSRNRDNRCALARRLANQFRRIQPIALGRALQNLSHTPSMEPQLLVKSRRFECPKKKFWSERNKTRARESPHPRKPANSSTKKSNT